jgi:hypothetical protein
MVVFDTVFLKFAIYFFQLIGERWVLSNKKWFFFANKPKLILVGRGSFVVSKKLETGF